MKKHSLLLALILPLFVGSMALAQQVPISGLPNGGLMVQTDTVPMVRNGVTMKAQPYIWPTTGQVMVSNGTSAPFGVAPINGDCLVGISGAWKAAPCVYTGGVSVTGTPTVGNLTKFSGGNSITNGNLSGDITTANSLAATLATVNGNVGSFGSSTAIPSFTVNAKGLVTAASSNAVIAPFSTLSGAAAQGNILYYTGSAWAVLAPGTSGWFLKTQGVGANPVWAAAGSGSVTSVTFTGDGTVLSSTPSGAVTTSGTVTASLANAATKTLLGNATAGSAAPTYLSVDSVNAMLGIVSLHPQGRLTLSSSAPVMTTDATAQTTVYYLPYQGSMVPIYDGTQFNYFNIGGSGISLTLNTTNMPSTQVFDVYVTNQAGTPTLCAMYWGGNTSRSASVGGKTGAANATISQVNGTWTNAATIATANCFNNTTSYAITQNQGTMLGTFYTTANGQTGVNIKPAAANGGTNNIVGVSNAYNRVPIQSIAMDNKASWTYATATWRAADNSNSNRVTWVDSLQQVAIKANYTVYAAEGTAGNGIYTGVNLDSTSATPTITSSVTQGVASNGASQGIWESFPPQLGLHYIQAMEDSPSASTITYTGLIGGGGIGAFLITDLEY